ncbi:MAG: tRNA epoxyqueuosine(34) reductase QueG [Verrucomicrobiae bacterium]|nr:tRNA epoxyqueuosine(34) reductase QueG [Verrucomicrobiae bacterium]
MAPPPTHPVRAFALGLGFDLVGFTSAAPPPHAAYFEQWLAEHKHGAMDWLARNAAKRTDPARILQNAKSVIVLGLNYGPGTESLPAPDEPTGRVARYARGADYHDLVWDKLVLFEKYLSAQFAAESLGYCDTGPLLERDLAARAGIGWQGKSTMLIAPRLGTYFFLAEIITTLELPPDPPQADHCGSCTRCLRACPTGAITAPYRMDARLCISYQTIENKGSIPVELRPLLGDRIYGCDDCLEVCPWNRFALDSRTAQFAGNEWTERPSLRQLLALTEDEFKTIFKNSPIKRIKRRGLLRNVCVALGNTGTATDLPALDRTARDAEPLIAEHARWAMEEIRKRRRLSGR